MHPNTFWTKNLFDLNYFGLELFLPPKVKASSSQGDGPGPCQGQSQDKVKAKERPSLMDFDTIEINLVCLKMIH